MSDIIEAHICWVRVCENCQDKTKEAFPYCVYDENGKYWEVLCNECYDALGCSYPDPWDHDDEEDLDLGWMKDYSFGSEDNP